MHYSENGVLEVSQAFGERGGVVGAEGYVAELAAGARLFAVEVEMSALSAENLGRVGQGADEV